MADGGSRPLSARGHLIGMVFWLVLAALVAYQLLTEDDGPGLEFVLLAVVLTNLAVLLVSYRNTLRRGERGASADGDAPGGAS